MKLYIIQQRAYILHAELQRRSQGILRPGKNYKIGAPSSVFNRIFLQ